MGVEKIVAIILLKAVLLGGPQGPQVIWNGSGPPALLTTESARARMAYVLRGDKLSHDSAAGLTVLIGPDTATVSALFEESGGESLREAVIEARQPAEWPGWEFDFPWPATGPAYYLEAVETDLYRRVELAEKAGYLGYVVPGGASGELAATVAFIRKVLSGGQYDETIRAYLGRPVIITNVVTATAPVEPGKPTLLIWHGDRQGAGPGSPLTTEQRDLLLEREALLRALQPQRDQIAAEIAAKEAALAETLKTHTENHPTVQALKAVIVFLKEKLTELEVAAAGAAEVVGPPAWAVGKWELRSPDADEIPILTVHPDGTVTIEKEGRAIPGVGSVDAQGRVEFRMIEAEGQEPEAVLAGRLNPDGTGSGTVPEENATWTATRVGKGPPAEREAEAGGAVTTMPLEPGQRIELSIPGGPLETPSRPGLDYGGASSVTGPWAQASPTSQGPSGVAVLLEVKALRAGVAPAQHREGFEALSSALAEASGRRGQLDLDAACTAAAPGKSAAPLVTVVPVKRQPGPGNPPDVALVRGERYVPLAAFAVSGRAGTLTQMILYLRGRINLEPKVYLVAVRPDDTRLGFALFAVDGETGRLQRTHRSSAWLDSVQEVASTEASALPDAFALFDRWLQPDLARCEVLMRHADGEQSSRLRLRLDVAAGPLAGSGQ